jgi:ubiquinone/menaquinone biosynthesis C-methylase UbiE
MRKNRQGYSYEAEKEFYFRSIPIEAKPYFHLDRYLRCWLDPELIFPNKRVLDIGAGECVYTRAIAEQFRPQSIVACELFRERMLPALRDNGNDSLHFVNGNCFSLPFKAHSFDIVFASGVLSQLPDLLHAVQEMARVLKPGGIFAGWEPNPFNPVILYRYLFKPHSSNQFLFWPHRVRPLFKAGGFSVKTKFFYVKIPWSKSRFLGTCIGIVARLRNDGKL